LRIARSWGQLITSAIVWSAASCGNDTVAPLQPAEFVGHYQLSSVDGHPLGWYHQLGAVDCSAAFTTGRLTIAPDQYFHLYLRYDYRCLGTDPFDGEGVLGVSGAEIRSTEDVIVLNGYGPDVFGLGVGKWSIEIRPQASNAQLEVRFWGLARQYWADPVLVMGPRETYNPACLTQPCP